MKFKESVENLTEIIVLCEEEIKNNDKDMTAVLDADDIMSLYTVLETLNTIKTHCKGFRAFCRRVRKTTNHDIDEFNTGREFLAAQLINLLNDEPDWSWEGKEFDKIIEEINKYCKNGGEENGNNKK